MYQSPLPARPTLIKQRLLAILASLLMLLGLSSQGIIHLTGPGCSSALSDDSSEPAEWAFNKKTYGWPRAYLSIPRERPGCQQVPIVSVVWDWLGVTINLLLAGGVGAAVYRVLTSRYRRIVG